MPTDPDSGRLVLADAVRWLTVATRTSPHLLEPNELLGTAAAGAGDYATAAAAYERAAGLAPGDAGPRLRQGIALLNAGRAEAALTPLRAAEAIAGPDTKVLLARAQAHEAAGDPAGAEDAYLRLLHLELAAERPGSPEAKEALAKLWRIARAANACDRLASVLTGIGAKHPQVASLPYYAACAFREVGDRYSEAFALAKVVAIAPLWMDGWRLYAEALLATKKPDEAAAALGKAVELGADREAMGALLLDASRALAGADRAADALALLDRFAETLGGEPAVREARGDLLFATGKHAEAFAAFEAAGLALKARKAKAALLREGAGAPFEAAPPPAAMPAPETLLDFDRPEVLLRVGEGATGRQEDGAFTFARLEEKTNLSGNFGVVFLPGLDATGFAAVRFDVKGPRGKCLLVELKDLYDEYTLWSEVFLRLACREPVTLTGGWQTVTLPLTAFVNVSEQRAMVPTTLACLRGIVFELRPAIRPDLPYAHEVTVDNVALLAPDGTATLLADFEREPREILTEWEATATPVFLTPMSQIDLDTWTVQGSTFVTPGSLAGTFRPGMAHSGTGSLRSTAPVFSGSEAAGPPATRMSFRPARDLSGAAAITFFARGETGGERIRVTLEDTTDLAMGNRRPAAGPRSVAGGKLVETAFTLAAEWQQFRLRPIRLPGGGLRLPRADPLRVRDGGEPRGEVRDLLPRRRGGGVIGPRPFVVAGCTL